MKQYREIKRQHLDAILLFRMGDFYEMFDQDAVTASKVLEITLTARNKSKGIETPLCGFPYHAVEGYIAKLIRRGFKVAVCEQVEDPKLAKGIVKREVIRVVTPGTVLDSNLLDAKDNNYLASLYPGEGRIRTFLPRHIDGGFFHCRSGGKGKPRVTGHPACPVHAAGDRAAERASVDPGLSTLLRAYTQAINAGDDWTFDRETAYRTLLDHFKVASLEGFGCSGMKLGISAAGAALRYIEETQKTGLANIRRLKPFLAREFMILDCVLPAKPGAGQEHLRRFDPGDAPVRTRFHDDLHGRQKIARMAPESADGRRRDRAAARRRCRVQGKPPASIRVSGPPSAEVYDLERLISRVSLGAANARDLLALKQSFTALPRSRTLLADCAGKLLYHLIEEWDRPAGRASAHRQSRPR